MSILNNELGEENTNIEETSHALFVDKPNEFNRVLEEFLSTLPEE